MMVVVLIRLLVCRRAVHGSALTAWHGNGRGFIGETRVFGQQKGACFVVQRSGNVNWMLLKCIAGNIIIIAKRTIKLIDIFVYLLLRIHRNLKLVVAFRVRVGSEIIISTCCRVVGESIIVVVAAAAALIRKPPIVLVVLIWRSG